MRDADQQQMQHQQHRDRAAEPEPAARTAKQTGFFSCRAKCENKLLRGHKAGEKLVEGVMEGAEGGEAQVMLGEEGRAQRAAGITAKGKE